MKYSYLANTRMYDASPRVAELWGELTKNISRRSGVSLFRIAHPWPADMEALWACPDMGCVFLCGKPFRNAGSRHKPLAVPLTKERGTFYVTRLLAREESGWTRLEDSFGTRLGWSVSHSHSGFNALRYTLLPYAVARGCTPLYSERVGPLDTPIRCLEALRQGRADVIPLDGYFFTLLARHRPESLSGLVTLAFSPAAPMPFLAAAPDTPDPVCAALRAALLRTADDPACRSLLEELALSGFAPVRAEDYALLDKWEEEASAVGYPLPA